MRIHNNPNRVEHTLDEPPGLPGYTPCAGDAREEV